MRRRAGPWLVPIALALCLASAAQAAPRTDLVRAGAARFEVLTPVLITGGAPGFEVRPAHAGGYQDWYLFAYGHDYARALKDLRALTGPTPLLPRSAFGVWFSRYWPYAEQDYHGLLAAFRSGRVP